MAAHLGGVGRRGHHEAGDRRAAAGGAGGRSRRAARHRADAGRSTGGDGCGRQGGGAQRRRPRSRDAGARPTRGSRSVSPTRARRRHGRRGGRCGTPPRRKWRVSSHADETAGRRRPGSSAICLTSNGVPTHLCSVADRSRPPAGGAGRRDHRRRRTGGYAWPVIELPVIGPRLQRPSGTVVRAASESDLHHHQEPGRDRAGGAHASSASVAGARAAGAAGRTPVAPLDRDLVVIAFAAEERDRLPGARTATSAAACAGGSRCDRSACATRRRAAGGWGPCGRPCAAPVHDALRVGHHPHGEGAEAVAEPRPDLGDVRPAHVLPGPRGARPASRGAPSAFLNPHRPGSVRMVLRFHAMLYLSLA